MRTIKWIGVVLLAVASGLTVQATLVTQSFTSGEGFTSGELNGQKGWITTTNAWTVNTSSGAAEKLGNFGGYALNTNSFTLAAQGTSEVFRTTFHFLGTPVAPTNSTGMMTVGFSAVASGNPSATDISNTAMQWWKPGLDIMSLRSDNNGNNLTPSNTDPLAGNMSDTFAIDYYIVLGTTAATSEFWAQLTNITDGNRVIGGFAKYTGLDTAVFNAATTTGLFPLISSSTLVNNNSGVTGISIDAMTVIPEPATLGLMIMSMAGLVAVRRMRNI